MRFAYKGSRNNRKNENESRFRLFDCTFFMASLILPTLTTVTGNGLNQYWKVHVIPSPDNISPAMIIREYGKVGGKPIISPVEIRVAKSRMNLTAQAEFEATKLWEDK